jgi:3-oxoacyl-[acyl-carrier-protein] synthase-3
MGTTIRSLGRYLPPRIERAGVERPIAVDPVGPSTLAAQAAREALERAGLATADVDFIIFATATPDVTFPGAGCFLQHQLECGTVGALDVRGQCAGFLYGLMIADQFLRTGTYRTILLAGGEVHSSGLDYSEAGAATAALFGDGAGVAILGAGAGPGLRAIDLHANGRDYQQFWSEFPASRQHPVRFTRENLLAGAHFPRVDTEALRRAGVPQLEGSIRNAVAAAGLRIDQIDRFIVSHILPDVAASALERVGVDAAGQTIPALRYGHIMGAALPVALCEDVDAGLAGPGAKVCLAAAGAGQAWGAAVIEL